MSILERSSHPKQKSVLLFLWIVFSLFVVYGTLIPFNWGSTGESISTNISRIVWTPFIDSDGSRTSIPDVVQNILLFIPFGFLGFFAFRKKNGGLLTLVIPRILVITILGLVLSTIVEILQLFVIDRITSVTDLVTNCTGTVIGAVSANALSGWLKKGFNSSVIQKVSRSGSLYPLLLSFIIVTVGALQPFDFTLDVGNIGSRVLYIFRNPFDFTFLIRDEPFLFFRFFLFGTISTYWIQENGYSQATLKGAILGGFTAVFLEGGQIFTKSHMPGAQDTLVMVLGGVCGAVSTPLTIGKLSPKLLCFFVVLVTVFCSGIHVLSPFRFTSDYRMMNWIPFLAHYERNFFTALTVFVERILIYFPMGFVLRLLLPKPTKYFMVICFIGLGIALPLEIIQGWVISRYPDVTDILSAFLGTLAGAWFGYSGWELFNQAMSNNHD